MSLRERFMFWFDVIFEDRMEKFSDGRLQLRVSFFLISIQSVLNYNELIPRR